MKALALGFRPLGEGAAAHVEEDEEEDEVVGVDTFSPLLATGLTDGSCLVVLSFPSTFAPPTASASTMSAFSLMDDGEVSDALVVVDEDDDEEEVGDEGISLKPGGGPEATLGALPLLSADDTPGPGDGDFDVAPPF